MYNRKLNKYEKAAGLLIILFIIFNFIPTGYNLMAPGVVRDLSGVIAVDDGYNGQEGSFYLTTVSSRSASIWDVIYLQLLSPAGRQIIPREEQIPPDMNIQEFNELMMELMEESKQLAQAQAFDQLGIDYEVEAEGVEVVGIIEGGTAEGFLKNGDLILSINGQEVIFAADAASTIRNREIGDSVDIKILRDQKEKEFTLQTVELDNNPGHPSIGIYITTRGLEYNFSRAVNFETNKIGGPSAGLMFALEIYNQLTIEDITSGHRIAGTGSLLTDGTVSEISGIKQKVLAAEKEGIDLFFVPIQNYEEAKSVAHKMEIAAVKSIQEAINYLRDLESNYLFDEIQSCSSVFGRFIQQGVNISGQQIIT